jgi:hypothetical protein
VTSSHSFSQGFYAWVDKGRSWLHSCAFSVGEERLLLHDDLDIVRIERICGLHQGPSHKYVQFALHEHPSFPLRFIFAYLSTYFSVECMA